MSKTSASIAQDQSPEAKESFGPVSLVGNENMPPKDNEMGSDQIPPVAPATPKGTSPGIHDAPCSGASANARPMRLEKGVRCCKRNPPNQCYGTVKYSGSTSGMWIVWWDDGTATHIHSNQIRTACEQEGREPCDPIVDASDGSGSESDGSGSESDRVSDCTFFGNDSEDSDFDPGDNSQSAQKRIEWSEMIEKTLEGQVIPIKGNEWRYIANCTEDVLQGSGEGGGKEIPCQQRTEVEREFFKKTKLKDFRFSSAHYAKPLLDVFLQLYPGNRRTHVAKINKFIQASGAQEVAVSEREWMTFIGCLIAATNFAESGANLWNKKKSTGCRAAASEFFSKMMPLDRFQKIKRWSVEAFRGDEDSDDPWFMIRPLLNDFNENRRKKVVHGTILVLDEIMSAWRPRTTKTGSGKTRSRTHGCMITVSLPHLSHLPRKPEPLGTEFKAVADAHSGMILHLEIMEEKEAMRKKQYVDELKAKPARVVRMIKNTIPLPDQSAAAPSASASASASDAEPPDLDVLQPHRKTLGGGMSRVVLGDADFGSIPAVVHLFKMTGRCAICVLKSQSAGFPKKFLMDQLQEAPPGSKIVLTCVIQNVTVLAIGYKYNYSKVLTFVATCGAASTLPGTPYIQRFVDQVGNPASRQVPRPIMLSRYFKYSDCIDSHNNLRQKRLAMEKTWVTQDAWFRLATTIIGICVIDTFRYVQHNRPQRHKYNNMTTKELADELALQLMDLPDNNGQHRFADRRPQWSKKRNFTRDIPLEFWTFRSRAGMQIERSDVTGRGELFVGLGKCALIKLDAINGSPPKKKQKKKRGGSKKKTRQRSCVWCLGAYGFKRELVTTCCERCSIPCHGITGSWRDRRNCWLLHLRYGRPADQAWQDPSKYNWFHDPLFDKSTWRANMNK